jgi:Ca-activated chloride channel family protein
MVRRRKMLFRIKFSISVLFLTSVFLGAQDPPDPLVIAVTSAIALPSVNFPLPAVPTIVKRVDEVNLLLSVTNHRGRFVQDLSPSDLVISDNGEPPVKITYFQRQTDLPLRVALVIDTSDSIKYRFAFEQKSAEAFLHKILRPESDMALVVSFNQLPKLVQPATDNLSKLGVAIRGLTNGGETALYDAVALAADELLAIPDVEPVRRVIVLVTDGADNHSHIRLDQAAEHALRAESVIYVVNTNDVVLSELDKDADRATKYLADATGGRTLYGASEHDVSKSLEKIQQELRSQYAVGYRPSHLISGLLFRTIRILGPKGVRIRYRAGYFVR